MTTAKQVKDAVTADTKGFSPKTGNWTFRREFFYRHGCNAQDFANRISAQLLAADISHSIVDCGEHNAPFKGGAGVRANSHWWVQIKVS